MEQPERPRGGLVEVIVEGELSARSISTVRTELERALALHPSRLIADLSRCTLLDAEGIALLVEVHRRIYRSEGRLVLRGCSPRCLRLLGLSGLTRVFEIETAPST